MVFALFLVVGALAFGQSDPAAHLAIVDRSPLVLRGSGFKAGERVRLTLKVGSREWSRTLVAADGSFEARFPGAVYDRCHGALVVAAAGSKGGKAGFELQPLPCPDSSPAVMSG